jgi:hypothetical protein
MRQPGSLPAEPTTPLLAQVPRIIFLFCYHAVEVSFAELAVLGELFHACFSGLRSYSHVNA